MADFETLFKKQMERDEGRKNRLYKDSEGIESIGIGRNMRRPLSEDEIDYLYRNDYLNHKKEMIKAFPWVLKLDDARFAALLNMFFNLGVDKFSEFKNMLRSAEAHQWSDAAMHALDSKWAAQVGERSKRVARQLETGVWN